MPAQSAALAGGGTGDTEALAGGIRLAFIVGASIAFVPLIASFFIKRAAAPDGMGGGH